jgi:hypothetical protein
MILNDVDSYLLCHCFSFLNPSELGALAVVSKTMNPAVDISVKLVLQQLSKRFLSAALVNPQKCMKVGNKMARRYLKLAWAYIRAHNNLPISQK